jgi:hypothetical protein
LTLDAFFKKFAAQFPEAALLVGAIGFQFAPCFFQAPILFWRLLSVISSPSGHFW